MIEPWLPIKLIAIAYVTLIHVVVALFVSRLIDRIIPDIEIDKTTNTEPLVRCLGLITLNLIMITISAYFIRNTVEKIPFPLDGVHDFNYGRLKERTNIVISSFLLMYYQTKLRQRFDILLLNKLPANT
jgi:hypothetical protein